MNSQINEYQPQSVTHPGVTLAEKLKELGMGSKEFAIRVDKPEKTISAILSENSSITPEMAVKFEDVLRIPASFWTKRQRRYDEYLARRKREKDIEEASDWARDFPYARMANLGWVPATRKIEEKVTSLFEFFGVSNQKAWESYYYHQALKVNFRISLAHTNQSLAVAAWLRQGELEASKMIAPAYNSVAFKKALPEIKNIMAQQPKSFFDQLRELCRQVGVKVVYTPCLPKAPIHGATRWLGEAPLIQLSARYKTNDKFWFTFFHEAGHILLHGKKYISIENVDYVDQDQEKEHEADEFAIKWTFSHEQEQKTVESFPLTDTTLSSLAKKFNTHPAMIIGRFQHKGLIHFSQGRKYIEPISLEDK